MTKKCPMCSGTGRVKDPAAIGAKMRKLREKTGVSLRTLATRLNFSAAYVSDLELGKRAWSDELETLYISALRTNATRKSRHPSPKASGAK